eukprot:TRINITY_DN31988_c0_g1_i1.p1 TRINITY_DN31988_c0_g1~~TRINITY_DN31988_c0_g1_i1.p1  ORF type:complete len:289 (-),score=56.98 TRINITY_DN31988_c0_g1_i1:57-923(-)
MLWDNINGVYGPLWSGGMFLLSSGRGVLHDEGADVEEELWRKRLAKETRNADVVDTEFDMSTYVKEHGPIGADASAHVVQLWFNPGIGQGRENQESSYQLLDAADVPEVPLSTEDGGIEKKNVTAHARVLLGEFGGAKSPARLFDASLMLLECQVSTANCSVEIPLPSGFTSAWIYALDGSADISVAATAASEKGCAEMSLLHSREIATVDGLKDIDSSTPMCLLMQIDEKAAGANLVGRFLVGAGKPFDLPWVKLLGNDGALLGPDGDFVRKKMQEFEEKGEEFGKT